MKKLLILLLIPIFLISCSDNNTSINTDITKVDSEIEKRAKKEGVSVSEMNRMIEELSKMTAENHQTTLEAYYEDLEKEGQTAFQVYATAADYMGITIKEYYEFEKSKPALSEEDKETVAAMNNIVNDMATDDEIDFYLEALDIIGVDELQFSSTIDNTLMITYDSNESLELLSDHYKTQLEFTANGYYMNAEDNVTIMGTLFEGFVNVLIVEDGGMVNVQYTFTGDLSKIEIKEKKAALTSISVEGMDFMDWAVFESEDIIDSQDDPNQGLEFVVYMSMANQESLADYFISVLMDSDDFIQLSENDTLYMQGTVNENLIEVELSRDAGISYIRVNRYY